MIARLVTLATTIAIMLVAWARVASAHELRSVEIVIEARSTTLAAVNVRSTARKPVVVHAPSGCSFDVAPTPSGVLRCPGGLAGVELDVGGLGEDVDIAWVRMNGFGGSEATTATVVTTRAARIALPGSASRSGVAMRYVRFGAEHVLSGLDHVLFMIALFWQAWSSGRADLRKTAKELLGTATAFTVAHSLTLVVTVLGIVRVAPALSEACIAFTLFLVALDIGRDGARNAQPLRARSARAGLAAAFGLVHGLGFAGALAETRLPEGARWTAIVAFNAGVEVGQVSVFACCLVVIAAARRTKSSTRLPARLATASAYVVGCAGAALFFQRLASLVHG